MQIFTLYSGNKVKGDGFSFSCTNKVLLATRTGIGYDKLVKIFTRDKKNYYEATEEELIIIRSQILHRGKQRIKASKSDTTYNRNRSHYS